MQMGPKGLTVFKTEYGKHSREKKEETKWECGWSRGFLRSRQREVNRKGKVKLWKTWDVRLKRQDVVCS